MATDSMQLLDDVITNLRNIIRNQTSKYHIIYGFVSELLRFKEYFFDHNIIKRKLSITESLPERNNNFGINLFRIIQELVNNSVKRSNCKERYIRFDYHNNLLHLIYKDNGTGFNTQLLIIKGIGLANIDARTILFKENILLNQCQAKKQAIVSNLNIPKH